MGKPGVREWPSGYKRIYLSNGTLWPHPDSEGPTEEVSIRTAYWHLLMHPGGTEAAVKTLRELRRILREKEQGE